MSENTRAPLVVTGHQSVNGRESMVLKARPFVPSDGALRRNGFDFGGATPEPLNSYQVLVDGVVHNARRRDANTFEFTPAEGPTARPDCQDGESQSQHGIGRAMRAETISIGDVMNVVRQTGDDLLTCFDSFEATQTAPRSPSRSIFLAWDIAPDGAVTRSCLVEPVDRRRTEFARCVTGRMLKWQFTPSSGPTRVRDFHFHPAALQFREPPEKDRLGIPDIMSGIARSQRELKACFVDAAGRGEIDTEAVLNLDWIIKPDGMVIEAQVTEVRIPPSTSVPDCVRSNMNSWKFPATSWSVPVKGYPMRWRPQAVEQL